MEVWPCDVLRKTGLYLSLEELREEEHDWWREQEGNMTLKKKERNPLGQ